MDAGNVNLGAISFIVLVIVAYNMVSFGVAFQSDSANDGRVSEG